MRTFKSWMSYGDFAHSVRQKNRYIFDKTVQDFIQAVIETCRSRHGEIPEGSGLYRAQLGCAIRPVFQDDEHVADEDWAHSPDRMMPMKGKSSEGRANPRGITYLYLANTKDTACAEVRPYKGAFISVALFKVKRELKVIDCTIDIKEVKGATIYLEEPEPEVREKNVWAEINKAFSKPVNPNDTETEYVPTQIIAEIFRKEGFDGIIYQSALVEKGLNVVLFDVNNVEMTSCCLTETNNINFDFEHSKYGYSCKNLKK
jgi:hypothetical protein